MKSKSIYSSLFLAATILFSATSAAWAEKDIRPILLADIDGDGKKDRFYHVYLSKKQVEFGVRLTKYKNKYVRISEYDLETSRKIVYEVESRKKYLSAIMCYKDCTDHRLETIDLLKKSKSPEIISGGYPESSTWAVFMDEKGKVIESFETD